MASKRKSHESDTLSRKQLSRPAFIRQRSSSESHGAVSRIGTALQSISPSTRDSPAFPSSQTVSLASCSSHVSITSPSRDVNVVSRPPLEVDADAVTTEDDDSLNETIMAIEMKEHGTIGCAYYAAREEKLYLVEDIKFASFDTIDVLKLHAQPTVILISTRSDERLEDYLSKEARVIDKAVGASTLSIPQYLTMLI